MYVCMCCVLCHNFYNNFKQFFSYEAFKHIFVQSASSHLSEYGSIYTPALLEVPQKLIKFFFEI